VEKGAQRQEGALQCVRCFCSSPKNQSHNLYSCGLRYARSRAKKEGTQAQRKRKEKGAVVKRGTSATPPTSATSSTGSYSAIRRNYDDSSFSSTGSGSGGSEAYPRLDDSTPSPSPPASNMNFVHYSPGDSHPHYPASGSNSFYSASPLSNPPVQPHSDSQSYTERASPAAHSPLTSTAPSFERERERDLLPPTPISAEPRHVRRSILQQ
jgi:hypothetical protein